MATTPDARPVPQPHADERTMLEGWLDFHRATLAMKCAGIDDTQARRASVASSSMTLLGLVQHLAEAERNWFQRIFAGQDVPPVYEDAGWDAFALSADRGLDEALATWRDEVSKSRELIAAASLDDSGTLSDQEAQYIGDKTISLRWILVHLIEEYARHNGHADLLREALDGVTGA